MGGEAALPGPFDCIHALALRLVLKDRYKCFHRVGQRRQSRRQLPARLMSVWKQLLAREGYVQAPA